MKKLKLSQWHDGSVKPVHVGWYEAIGDDLVYDKNGTAPRYWDGDKWLWNSSKHGFPLGMTDAQILATDKWRGVLK